MAFAIIFDSVGFGEWFVLLAVVLVVVGPKRLPSTARKVGQYYSKFRRAADSFKRQLLDMDTEFNRAIDEAEKATDETLKEAGVTEDVAPAENYDDSGPGRAYYEGVYDTGGGEPTESAAPVDESTTASSEKPTEKPSAEA